MASLRVGPLKSHRFDPRDGLDPTEVAILAVLNNPDLAAKRVARKVAAAQVFSAGLLPDPQIAVSADLPETKGADLFTGYNIAPSIDLLSLVTRSAALRSARESARHADLDLLWAEWSTAQQARQLAVTVLLNQMKVSVLRQLSNDIAARIAQLDHAYRRGDVANQTTSADLAAKLDADTQAQTAANEAAKARGDLNALLGLKPDVQLPLVDEAPAVKPVALIETALRDLPKRRPDLLALQAGYAAQEATVRKAVLSQFPLINLGFSHARDTSNIVTNGLAATFVVPIFNGNRGEIAVQTATREQLRAEYQARLDQTVADVVAAERGLSQARVLLGALREETPRLMAMARDAAPAYRRGDLDSGGYYSLRQSALTKQSALLDQELAVRIADIAVDTVLFLPSDLVDGTAP